MDDLERAKLFFEKRGLGCGICIIISDLWRRKTFSYAEYRRLSSKMTEMKNLPWYVKLYHRFRFKVTYRSTACYWWSLEHFSETITIAHRVFKATFQQVPEGLAQLIIEMSSDSPAARWGTTVSCRR